MLQHTLILSMLFSLRARHLFLACLLILPALVSAQPVTRLVELQDGEEITASVYGQHPGQRILWISSGFGFHERHHQVATLLASRGMEIWQVNLIDNLFMTRDADSMRNIPPQLVAELIEALSENGHYRILLLSSSYGSIPVIRGVHAWQKRAVKTASITGAVLLSPYFYTSVPTLGEAPDMIPELAVTNIPVYIFQEQKNANRWHLPEMLTALQQHAPAYSQVLDGVTSMFYDKDQATETRNTLENFDKLINKATRFLSRHTFPREAIPLSQQTPVSTSLGLDSGLTSYRGKVTPQAIRLRDVSGKPFNISDYHGKVTLINFWASWCPPCVEEIPSLNRLKQQMADRPFQLISINYAESAEQVNAFMKQVKVDFPVLIDPQGLTAGKWKVVAFPSTFVIGPDGNIHYGVNAAIHWDDKAVIRQLKQLLPEN